MARIDFAFGAPDRLRTACAATRKRYLAGERVLAYCSDPQRLTAFDRMLWAFDPTSFIPHVGVDDPLAAVTPVVLSSTSPASWLQTRGAGDAAPWVLNLDDGCVPDAGQFSRIMEIVSDDEADKHLARQRWRAYAAAGHDVRSHALKRPTSQDPA